MYCLCRLDMTLMGWLRYKNLYSMNQFASFVTGGISWKNFLPLGENSLKSSPHFQNISDTWEVTSYLQMLFPLAEWLKNILGESIHLKFFIWYVFMRKNFILWCYHIILFILS